MKLACTQLLAFSIMEKEPTPTRKFKVLYYKCIWQVKNNIFPNEIGTNM
jgi:hypothetical protein